MDTGILSIILHQQPYQFHGIGVLSTIMFVLNVVQFTLISFFLLLRCIKHPKETYNSVFSNPEDIAYLAAGAVAWLTIAAQLVLTCAQAWGHGWSVAAIVFWWIGLAWAVTVCAMMIICFARYNLTGPEQLSPAVFMPTVALATSGAMGGLITSYGVDLSARLALPTVIVGYMSTGYGFFTCLILYPIFLQRLMVNGWPPYAKIPGMMLLIGPMGQTGTALQYLSNAAFIRGVFRTYDEGTYLQQSAASATDAASILLSLMILGFAVLWIILVFFALGEGLVKRQIPLGLIWWSTIFPLGTVVTCMTALATEMNSPTWKVLCAIVTIFMFILYFFNMAFTIPYIITGRARGVPKEKDIDHEKAERGQARAENEEIDS